MFLYTAIITVFMCDKSWMISFPTEKVINRSEKTSFRDTFGFGQREKPVYEQTIETKHVSNRIWEHFWSKFISVFNLRSLQVVAAMLEAGMDIFSYYSVQGDELIVLFRCPVSFQLDSLMQKSKWLRYIIRSAKLPVLQRFADKSEFFMQADPVFLEHALQNGNPAKRIAPIYITHDRAISEIRPTEYSKHNAVQRYLQPVNCFYFAM